MKWGKTRRTWGDVDMRAAGAACAAQLPVAGLLLFVLSLDDDDHGIGGGPYFGLFCAVLFAPLLLPVLGLLHSAVLTLPAVWLGRRGAAWSGRGTEWAWSVGCLPVVGAAWAGFFALLGGPLVLLVSCFTASGLVPALNVAYCRRREARLGRPLRKVWILSGLISIGLSAALIGAAVLATLTGLIKEYEPPRLSPAQVAGAWRSEDGGEVLFRLYADHRAELASCGGATGVWSMGVEGFSERPAVEVGPGPGGCSERQTWLVGGTEGEPELFVNSGDMDSPDLEILHRER
ncbi:hypothetical protein [Streptomyces sp. NPDC058308]|uniref:hypothetical protein n=1 Tax=Streptomyces sp. NPDC058308 TaxID=3346440 RepID=UPI0036E6ED2B